MPIRAGLPAPGSQSLHKTGWNARDTVHACHLTHSLTYVPVALLIFQTHERACRTSTGTYRVQHDVAHHGPNHPIWELDPASEEQH